MTTPKVFLEELIARRGSLTEQLQLMENHLSNPPLSPSFGTHADHKSTTEESISRVKDQIAELDDVIANFGTSPQD